MSLAKHLIRAKSPLTIAVGEGDVQKLFYVHESLVCGRSRFFRACLNGNWKESKERIVNLPHDDPWIFSLWAQSLYTLSISQSAAEELDPKRFVTLAGLFALTVTLKDDVGKAIVTRAIFNKVSDFFLPWHKGYNKEIVEMIRVIYESTVAGAPIRRLLVDAHLWFTTETDAVTDDWQEQQRKTVSKSFQEVPVEFLEELALALMEQNSRMKRHKKVLGFNVQDYLEKAPAHQAGISK